MEVPTKTRDETTGAMEAVHDEVINIARKKSPFVLSKIGTNLYLGNMEAVSIVENLENSKEWFVLSAMKNPPKMERANQLILKIDDRPDVNIIKWFDFMSNVINEALLTDKKVLVHCAAGVSRSVSFMCAYLMKIKRMRYAEALIYIRTHRLIANPNEGFKKQLREYDSLLFKESKQHEQRKLQLSF